MKKNKHICLLLMFCTLGLSLTAQKLISSTYLETQTKEFLSNEFDINAIYDVDLYTILYETLDIHGVLDTASGLLVLPNTIEDTYPMLCYQHGTVTSRWDVPSQLAGGSELAIIFGGLGYVTTAADFLGLGEARGIHPYVHADTEASAAIDSIRAAKEYADLNNVLLNDQLFVTGYSQGGHAAMAAHRELELSLSNEFTVTAAAPMSGPYSVSDKMIEFTMGDDPYFTVAYLGWVALSFNEAYGLFDDLEDFFKPFYASSVQKFANEEINLISLNIELLLTLAATGNAQKPKEMLQDSIKEIILSGVDHPINDALRDNDVFDWTPTAPTRLFYCTADDQVYFENSILASEVMNANGATDVAAMNVGTNLTHGECVNPAMLATIDFFAQFQEVSVNIFDVKQDETLFDIQPNPVRETLYITVDETLASDYQVSLLDVNGRLIKTQQSVGSDVMELSVNEVTKGIYFLNITSDQRTLTKKVVVE